MRRKEYLASRGTAAPQVSCPGRVYPLALAVIVIGPLAFITAGAAPAPGTRRAVWTEHDLTIDLEHLPRSYSCSDLRYKIHDVLQAIGARPNIRIDVSRCEPNLDTQLDPPRAHLIFSLPIEVRGHLADFYETFVVERTVRIEPGNPPSIDFSDCRLLRQLQLTLFKSVSMPAEANHLDCRAAVTKHVPFSLSIEALIAAPSPVKAGLVH